MNAFLKQTIPQNEGGQAPQAEQRAAEGLMAQEVSALMAQYNYRFVNEDELQRAIAQVLEDAGIKIERERPISARNRLDLWLPDSGIAIEVKIAGSLSAAMRQVERYMELDEVSGVVLAGARAWARTAAPTGLPKPFALCYLRSAM